MSRDAGRQSASETLVDRAIEQLGLVGYAVVDGGYSTAELAALSAAFDRARDANRAQHGGRIALAEIAEHQTIRLPMLHERRFLDLAAHGVILEIARRMIADYIVLNQQNGLANPVGETYTQRQYHRDLPYQHYVSSRPLGVTALFCLDPFTAENGATWVVPGSHKQETFPSDAVVEALQVQVPAPAGHFIVLDSMLFHAGGANRTEGERRAVNHVYTTPLIKQQIALPTALGEAFTTAPELRRLLGYEAQVPADVASYYASRRARRS